MAQVKELVIKFKQSASEDVTANRVRIRPANTPTAYDSPYHDVPKLAADDDGYTRIPLADVPQAEGLDGQYDVHVTALDDVGNESDFLEIDNQTFDIEPPAAPTDGSVE